MEIFILSKTVLVDGAGESFPEMIYGKWIPPAPSNNKR